ncbi:MAG: hypothetical protein ACKESB_01860 [Candidatus Hodgkinia cicadicola]
MLAKIEALARDLKLATIQRMNASLSEAEFKKTRLLSGVYLQLHSHMLRVAIECGELTARQLGALALLSVKYDRGYFHITTRQNVQFNWVNPWEAAKLSEALTRIGLSSSYTAGNCVRQITCDPTHGTSLSEVVDTAPVVKALRNKLCFGNSLIKLPKKVKICVWSGAEDEVLGGFHDIGIRLVENKAYVTVGGGLGRSPKVGQKLVKLSTVKLLHWISSFLKVYAAAAAGHPPFRTKTLVANLGKQAIVKLTADVASLSASQSLHIPASGSSMVVRPASLISWYNTESFERWYTQNTSAHKIRGLRRVELGCSSTFSPPADVSASDALTLCEVAQRYSMDQIRISLRQTFILPSVHITNLTKVFTLCSRFELQNVVCCPGLDYCALANSRSILMAQKLALLKTGLQIRVSGCVNACSHHHVFDVGVIGINKAGTEAYQLVVGGSAKNRKLCRTLCKALPAYKVVGFVARFAAAIKTLRKDSFESVYQCFVRSKMRLNKVKPRTFSSGR